MRPVVFPLIAQSGFNGDAKPIGCIFVATIPLGPNSNVKCNFANFLAIDCKSRNLLFRSEPQNISAKCMVIADRRTVFNGLKFEAVLKYIPRIAHSGVRPRAGAVAVILQ